MACGGVGVVFAVVDVVFGVVDASPGVVDVFFVAVESCLVVAGGSFASIASLLSAC